MKLSKHLILQELINPDIYDKIGNRSLDFIHPTLAPVIQILRDEIDEAITINDWYWGGNYEDSGLRLPTGDVGASMSAHKFGCAADLKFKTRSTDDVLQHILDNQEYYTNITRIEDIEHTRSQHGEQGRDWLHIEVGIRHATGITIFKP